MTIYTKRPGFGRELDFTKYSPLDAFGRLKTSQPITLFDSQLQYNSSNLFFHTVTSGTGTTSHNINESSLTLSVLAGGDSVIRQSKQYFRYQPSKSQEILMTGAFGTTPNDDLVRRMGYFDDQNGIFLQQDSGGLKWVKRTYTSGAVVEEVVSQTSWSEDGFLNLDPSNTFLMFIDLEWLGVGQARCGFYNNGIPIVSHIFNVRPSDDKVYISTANLPVRWEISSAANETGTMKQICCAVISDGGFEVSNGIPHAIDNTGSPSSISTTETPVLAIRPKTTFGTITNRGTIFPESIQLFSDTASNYRIYYNANVTTAASWTSHGTNSIVEYDTSATAFTSTNAELIDSGFIAASSRNSAGSTGNTLTTKLPLTLDFNGANPIELVVTMTTISGTGNGYSSLRWRELY